MQATRAPRLARLGPEESFATPRVIKEQIRRREKEIGMLNDALRALEAIKPLVSGDPSSKAVLRIQNSQDAPDQGESTGIRDAIRVFAASTPRFCPAELLEHLQQQNFTFERDPRAAVRDALYMMSRPGKELKIVKRGRGGKPNTYESQAAASALTDTQ